MVIPSADNKRIDRSYPIHSLPGVGPKIAMYLARLNIYSVFDLLFHLPMRYQDRTQIVPIHNLNPGDEAVVEGTIKTIATFSSKTKLLCELHDETRKIFLRFYHLHSFQAQLLKPGAKLRCYSKVRFGPKGLEMIHPEFQVLKMGTTVPLQQHLTPCYPTTEGLSQNILRKLITHALTFLEDKSFLEELLPNFVLEPLSFPTLSVALKFVHQPPRETIINDLLEYKTLPQKRLIFEELLSHRLSILHLNKKFKCKMAPALCKSEGYLQGFLDHLPFKLTKAQERVSQEINVDLKRAQPMLRLVQGDVGSGKTVIAALALLQAYENGYQAVMMAPTELLAEQHYRVFKQLFEPLGIEVAFLSGKINAREKKTTLTAIKNDNVRVIVGTHALFQEDVHFARLALVIIDEQHRFGVHQRALLHEKGAHQENDVPHQLVMTATPIPRTLAMSFYADLNCSIIDELPPGRMPIRTSIIDSSRRNEVIARIREALKQGRQAYWVCPLIEESETIPCQAATKTASELQKQLKGFTIGLIHGRLSANEKESVMNAFQQGEIVLLVATTVIEVGVDVPNASLMIIDNAERLGLSQLHQLRGRIGRGRIESHCVLLYQNPLSNLAKERLTIMRETFDGFTIAQQDLALRGPGEVLGVKQTGALSFRIADLLRDHEMMSDIAYVAELIMQEHEHIIKPLKERWLRNVNETQEYFN